MRPAPLIAADVDLRDFPFTPMFRARLFGSEFHANATDAEWRAGLTLWLKSWDQVPAGSLPSEDVALCRLAELGRDMKTWRKIKAGSLRGWVECADGRLYHKVVAEGVLEAWEGKLKQRWRTECARLKKAAQRNKEDVALPTFDEWRLSPTTNQRCPQGQIEMSPGTNEDVTGEIGSKGQGKRKGQGELYNTQSSRSSQSMPDTARATDAPRAAPPSFDPRYREVQERCEAILNSPNCLVWARVNAWLQQGAEPELDIYPSLERLKANWRGRNLDYFDGAIADSIASRTKPLPAGQARASPNDRVDVDEWLKQQGKRNDAA